MRRRRWLLRGGWLTAILVVCLLLGRGAGWFGTEPGNAGNSGVSPATQPPVSPPVRSSEPGATGSPATSPGPVATAQDGAAKPAAQSPPPAADGTTPVTPMREPVDADRVASVRALAIEEAGAGYFGRARQALADLTRLLPAGDAAPEVIQLREQLATLQAMAIESLCRDLAEGRVLAARVRLDALLAVPDQAIADALDAAASSRSWPRLSLAGGPPAVPAASPLPADRLVRVLREGQERTGRVVSALATEATLRIVEARGVTFPTLPVTTVEPVDVTSAEALQQARAAAAAGDGRLVRLWVACGLARAGVLPATDLMALRALLR